MAWCARRGSLPARLALVVGVLLLQACEEVQVTTVGATSIELEPATATVAVQSKVRLSARVLGDGGVPLAGRSIQWTSLDPDIAVVESDGTVTGVTPGTARIQATSEGVSSTATVTVTAGPAIRLTPSAVEFTATRNGASPGDRTISVSNDGGGTLGSLGASVRYVTGTGGWLSASLSGPTAPASLVLSVSQGSLPDGTYTAAVDVASPDAAGAPATVNVTLTILGPQPAIALGVTSVSFVTAAGGSDPDEQSVGITNAGGGTLSGLSAAIEYASGQPTGWLVATLADTTAPASLVLRATTGQLTTGTYTASVRISSATAQNSPQTLTVSFTVGTAQPVIRLDPAELSFTARVGGAAPGTQAVAITNGGGGSLIELNVSVAYPGGQPSGWLAATLSGTAAPATLTVAATTGALTPGTYNATVQVAASTASNSPQLVQVTFTLAAPAPSIAVSTSSAQFDAALSGADPAPVQISVTNGGGGTLDDLSATVSYPSGQPTDWLTAGLSGTTAPATLTLTAARGSLGTGTYTATVRVAATSADNSPVDIGATFTITQDAQSPPAAPGSLTATPVSDRRINLGWSDNSTDETRFDVERSNDSGNSWAAAGTVDANVTTFADESGLTGSTAYSYRVFACNAGGCSAASPPASATTAPEMPSDVSATAASATQINVTWSDNSPDETGFIVERATGDSQTWTAVHTAAANATSFGDTGLSGSTTYRYRVLACRDTVCSRHSGESSATTPMPAPAAPTGLTATAVSTSRIDLAWSASTGTVDEYRIERRTGGDSFGVVATVDGSTTSYSNTSLSAATEYTYRVQACNDSGCSGYSNEASATTHSLLVPTTPTSFSATGVSPSQIDLSWDHDGELLVSGFEIQRAPESDPDAFAALASVDASARSYSNDGLPASSTFHYRIRACSTVGCSGWASASGTTQAEISTPNVPSDVSATALSQTEISLTWTAPGGQTHYEIRRREGRGGPWTFSTGADGSATEYVDSGLSSNSVYQYQIRACATSCSQYSDTAEATTEKDDSVISSGNLSVTHRND